MSAISASWTDSRIMLRRNFKHMLRNPVTIFNGALMPVVLMLLLVYVLGNAFSVGERYIQYATPGLILLAITYGLAGTAVSVNSDMTKGIINRFKVMNVSRSAVLNGHVAATVLGSSVAIAAIIGMAFALGFRSSATVGDWFGAIGIIAATAFAAAWFTVALGMAAKTPESAGMAVVPLILLPFLSSAIVPADKMGRVSGSLRSTSPSRRSSNRCVDCSPVPRRAATWPPLWPGAPGSPSSGTCGHGPRSTGERSFGQFRPVGLLPLLRCLGEPRFAEATPCGLFDPSHIRLRKIRRSAHPSTRREQPCGLLVPFAAQRQVRDPDEYLRDQRRNPRLQRGLERRDAVLAGLVEAVGEVTEQVVCCRPGDGLLRGPGCWPRRRAAGVPARCRRSSGPAPPWSGPGRPACTATRPVPRTAAPRPWPPRSTPHHPSASTAEPAVTVSEPHLRWRRPR